MKNALKVSLLALVALFLGTISASAQEKAVNEVKTEKVTVSPLSSSSPSMANPDAAPTKKACCKDKGESCKKGEGKACCKKEDGKKCEHGDSKKSCSGHKDGEKHEEHKHE